MFTTSAAADRGMAVYLRNHPPADEPVGAFAATTSRTRQPLQVVQSYIPGDVLAGYLPISALIVAAHIGVLDIIVQICFGVLTVIATGIQLRNKLVRNNIDLHYYQLPKWPIIASALSYLAFSATLPSSGFALLPGFQPFMGAVVVGIAGVFLEVVSPLVEKR